MVHTNHSMASAFWHIRTALNMHWRSAKVGMSPALSFGSVFWTEHLSLCLTNLIVYYYIRQAVSAVPI